MLKNLWDFITPQWEPLQATFAVVIAFTLAYTMAGVWRHANAKNWEAIWHRGGAGGNGYLDIEHGSVSELSDAVATRHERLAEIMPGLLLIIGLLGTFLGLGMALDKASTILAGAGNGVSPDTMSNMMEMMHGLGSKFKTSTWGILAYLVLKTYCSSNAFEERRLAWCISKMKVEVDLQRLQARELRAADNARLVDAIENMGAALLNRAEMNAIDDGERHREAIAGADRQHRESLNRIDVQVEHGQATRNALEQFVGSVGMNISAMAEAASGMAESAKESGESTRELRVTIGEFGSTVGKVLHDMDRELNATVNSMSNVFTTNMQSMAGELSSATQAISYAIEKLSEGVDQTLQSVKQSNEASMKVNQKAQEMFIATSSDLSTNIIAVTSLINDVRERITSGLAAVSASGQRMQSLDRRFGELAGKMEESASAIQVMSGHFAAVVRQMEASAEGPVLAKLVAIERLLAGAIAQMHKPAEPLRLAIGVSDRVADQTP